MIGLAAICLVWAGMVLGISFLATPAKFTAPSITLATGLDVGRHVFRAFNRVEIAAALLCASLIWMNRSQRLVSVLVGTIFVIVALQTLWLLPVLDQRVSWMLAGQSPPSAPYHYVYIGAELIKVLCLLTVGVTSIARLPAEARLQEPQADVADIGTDRSFRHLDK